MISERQIHAQINPTGTGIVVTKTAIFLTTVPLLTRVLNHLWDKQKSQVLAPASKKQPGNLFTTASSYKTTAAACRAQLYRPFDLTCPSWQADGQERMQF